MQGLTHLPSVRPQAWSFECPCGNAGRQMPNTTKPGNSGVCGGTRNRLWGCWAPAAGQDGRAHLSRGRLCSYPGLDGLLPLGGGDVPSLGLWPTRQARDPGRSTATVACSWLEMRWGLCAGCRAVSWATAALALIHCISSGPPTQPSPGGRRPHHAWSPGLGQVAALGAFGHWRRPAGGRLICGGKRPCRELGDAPEVGLRPGLSPPHTPAPGGSSPASSRPPCGFSGTAFQLLGEGSSAGEGESEAPSLATGMGRSLEANQGG